MKIESIEDLGAFIKESRLKYNVTQASVAYASKVERSLINRLENGKIVAPIDNMRFDDTIYNVFGNNLESVTDTHQLIPNIGTYDGRDFGGKYCPGILLKNFSLTL